MLAVAWQLEEIALDPDAEEGKGSIGSTAALNTNFTQTQAQTQAQTQGTQGAPQPKVRQSPLLPLETPQATYPPYSLLTISAKQNAEVMLGRSGRVYDNPCLHHPALHMQSSYLHVTL